MSKLQKIASLCMLIVLGLSIIQQPVAPVAAVEPQQPSSPGTWSQAFASPLRINISYMPSRPIEWNGMLYAGITTYSSNSTGSGVGYWNGQQWLKLEGLDGFVHSVTVHQNKLYAAGGLKLGGKDVNIAYWDGQLWTALPYRLNNDSYLLLASHENQLYLGGSKIVIDGQAHGIVARWDGVTWQTINNELQGWVVGFLLRPDGMYLHGVFVMNGKRSGVLRVTDTQLTLVGEGFYGLVYDLKEFNNQLYISGQFTSTLQPSIKNVATWDGTAWNSIGNGISNPTHNLAMVDGELYALSRSSNFQLLRWDTTQWTTLSTMSSHYTGSYNWPRYPDAVLLNYNQELLAFGPMISWHPIPNSTQYIKGQATLRWVDDHWESMTPNGIEGSGSSDRTAVLTTDNEDLYVAFEQIVWGTFSSTLAHLNPSNQWQSLLARTHQPNLSYAQALQKYQQTFFGLYQSTLYQADNNNNTWTQAVTATVHSLAQANNLLYVAGDFEQFNGVTARNLVTWNGSQWQALNTPASFDRVVIVEAQGNAVYISDGFQIARWDGTQWTTLATNVVNIGEIEPTADGVYIAGTFSSVAGVSASKIAYWNGTTWSGLSGVIDGAIHDLAMGADGLYVAGSFRGITNGIVSGGILRWDGTAWHGLAGGVQSIMVSTLPGKVYSLAATPTRMLMHGNFVRVGNQYESYNIAAWEYGNEPLIKAKPDYAITYRPQPVTVNVLANDWSDQPSQLQLVSVTPPSNGSVAINGTNIVYTPAAQFQGTDTFTYTVRDPLNAVTTTAQVRVQVWNHFPFIADKERQVQPVDETIFFPLNGLVDLNGDPLTITHARAVSGTVQIDADMLRYLPPQQQQFFTDTLTYTVSDGHGGQQTARIKLYSTNASVVAVNDNATTYRPHAVRIDVLANDWAVNNEPLQLVSVNRPAHGTATISGNQVHYLPAASFQGLVSVHYTVRNVTRGSIASGIVLIDVQNHVPTVSPMTLTVQPQSTTTIDVLTQANDINGDVLTISQAIATVGEVDIIDNQLYYHSPTSYPFTATISYRLDDDHGGVTEGTITVNSARYQLFLPYISK
ncbi:Ig-like domain-containing protein [Herpetosiphon sp. NSE202]|uniref:Ig-like domain-containing protein n=1 Tax=Herpetosiphon sp. NSE202 TaxID=3351349 RepID=UPI00362D5E5F